MLLESLRGLSIAQDGASRPDEAPCIAIDHVALVTCRHAARLPFLYLPLKSNLFSVMSIYNGRSQVKSFVYVRRRVFKRQVSAEEAKHHPCTIPCPSRCTVVILSNNSFCNGVDQCDIWVAAMSDQKLTRDVMAGNARARHGTIDEHRRFVSTLTSLIAPAVLDLP